MLRNFLLVGLGGACGSMMRFGISLLLPRVSTASFPLSTLIVNISGCLLIGLLAGIALRSEWMNVTGWTLLAAGICGGFTTFSSFSYESILLIKAGHYVSALLYISGS